MGSDTSRKAPVVYVDTARNRNHPVAGWHLLKRLLRRVFVTATIAAGAGTLVWAVSTPPARLLVAFLVAFFGLSLAFLVLFGGAILGDYQHKRVLADKYGLDLRLGLDTFQRRFLVVESPPANLDQRIVQALQAIGEDAKVRQVDSDRFDARLPRKGPRVRCDVAVQICRSQRELVRMSVESRLTEPLGFNDSGRNIVNVEEFQRALVRLLGADQRSLSEDFAAPPLGD